MEMHPEDKLRHDIEDLIKQYEEESGEIIRYIKLSRWGDDPSVWVYPEGSEVIYGAEHFTPESVSELLAPINEIVWKFHEDLDNTGGTILMSKIEKSLHIIKEIIYSGEKV